MLQVRVIRKGNSESLDVPKAQINKVLASLIKDPEVRHIMVGCQIVPNVNHRRFYSRDAYGNWFHRQISNSKWQV